MDSLEFGTELTDIRALELALERARLQGSLYDFLLAAWPIVEPEMPFVANWHVKVLCKILQDITLKKVKEERWVINIPPGSLKSLLISVIWPAWVWARQPKRRFLTASYSAHLSLRDNLRTRDILLSTWFQELFPIKLVDDQNTKTQYNTDAGGWRFATSVGGAGTGEHPDYIIIDDATTAAQAESEPERSRANQWFDRTISSRGMSRNVTIIVIGQRLHMDDLPGHLLSRGGWGHVCFPMRYEAPRPKTDEDPGYQPDPRDIRTEPGELLFPALFTEAKVRQLELDLGPYGAAGQLQQRPSPEGGGLFRRGWFRFLDATPKDLTRTVRGWDTAGSEGKGDWTVGCKIGERADGSIVVLDVQRDQLSPAGVDLLMRATAKLDGLDCAQREEKEGGASGKAVVDIRAKQAMKGFDYAAVQVSGDKVTRAKPLRSQVEAGNVYLVRGPWNECYIVELCAFPTSSHDDQVDASSCAFNALLLEPRKKKFESSW